MPNLLQFSETGIFCPQAGVFIDPCKPVQKALITLGHAEHARWGHARYLAHREAAPIIRFPRIHRWRKDKKIEDANRLDDLREMV